MTATPRTRPTGVFKRSNDYAASLPNYAETPKAVYAALALSLAMRLCEDNEADARALLGAEWATLHRLGLVPQKPVGVVS